MPGIKERRGCIRRIEDKDILERIATMLTQVQTDMKLLKGETELLLFRLLQIEKKLGINHD